ncbi:hypothetical protein M9Y10_041540 [Tritrichomonas musculus]|uniref:Nucleoplasmin-like domain-containing protein n=1 Tax=Tritrichomonas musculus TaxID=1915356 RepID=A0ABR2K4L3_9EUKA
MDFQTFASVVVNPKEQVKVSLEDSIWTMTSVAIVVKDDLPKEGRVVLYVSNYDEKGEIGKKIAIAPLRVCECEVINIDLQTYGPIVFSTEGADISVSISGCTSRSYPLIVERTPIQ